MDYGQVKEALQVLGLGERASLKELREQYRLLARQYHPDTGAGDQQLMQRVNEAYALLLAYVKNYRFSFAEEEFYEQQPEARLRQQFSDDPLWGDT